MQRSAAPLLLRTLRWRGFSSSSSDKIVAAVLFERLPVVIPKIDPVVYAFQEFSGKGDYQIDYVPAPRITEADKTNDRRLLQRALDRRLYLLLNGSTYGAPDKKPVWHFPEKVYENEETLRLCAESALRSVLGGLHHTYFVGNAPMAHMTVEPKEHSSDTPSFKVTEALSQAGLESSNLIVGIDFTKSNEWTGRVSFNRRCLHDIGHTPNPYEQAISIIGRTLSAFDEDNLIPCFGFGDASTHDQEVFSFYPDNQPCNGFEEALQRYRELVPHLRLAGLYDALIDVLYFCQPYMGYSEVPIWSQLWTFLTGPTSFAPMIETAIGIVDHSGGQYHVLLIIADGQVTRSVDTIYGQLSSQERDTVNAIVKASDYPLSIVLVGVGDGPWDMMREFDDNIPSRAFDNFQFVNFTEIMGRNIAISKKETEFALAALMEIPSQYKATIHLQLLGFVPFACGKLRISHLVVGIRLAMSVEKTCRSAQFARAR
ncbi:hypothetical protein COCNU_11G006170 [Cocos nucifera]|uniref:Copine C-terminal domain-containing protein n=1 Tax=Cocos nucifera TaxID=13894 RepID=A0A8K0IPC8_COCNU|nr:hypothetical protein COCNU_11G006170 [Cocos nucifera]